MNPANPLQKFFRQPKIYVTLPSKGLFYEPGAFIGDYNNVPVFAMTGMDEIVYKTPDALYSGEATAKVIESCCPFVKNAKVMPSIDIDALIIAIRIATFGDKLSVSQKCTACETENDYDIDLKGMLDYFNNLKFIFWDIFFFIIDLYSLDPLRKINPQEVNKKKRLKNIFEIGNNFYFLNYY